MHQEAIRRWVSLATSAIILTAIVGGTAVLLHRTVMNNADDASLIASAKALPHHPPAVHGRVAQLAVWHRPKVPPRTAPRVVWVPGPSTTQTVTRQAPPAPVQTQATAPSPPSDDEHDNGGDD